MNEIRNECNFLGRLGRDPELRYFPSGSAYATFGLAINMRAKLEDGKWGEKTTWVDFVIFGDSAERFVKVCKKGTLLSVKSEYRKRQYESNGENRTAHEFMVRSFEALAGRREKGEVADDDATPGAAETEDDYQFPF